MLGYLYLKSVLSCPMPIQLVSYGIKKNGDFSRSIGVILIEFYHEIDSYRIHYKSTLHKNDLIK